MSVTCVLPEVCPRPFQRHGRFAMNKLEELVGLAITWCNFVSIIDKELCTSIMYHCALEDRHDIEIFTKLGNECHLI